jgi:hypothetical protein
MEDDDQVIVGFSKFRFNFDKKKRNNFTVKNGCPEQNCSQIRSD